MATSDQTAPEPFFTRGVAAFLLAVGAFAVISWIEYRPERRSLEQVFLAEMKENAGCDPTTLVPFEQLEIRLTKTTDELFAICERYTPSRKLRVGDFK